tara:strand:+ start:1078 stop:1644 length:567 start_codon:yes stop_codon:yes gene_type:complete
MEKALEQNPSSCVKIVLFGPESSGKTTLATQLAAHFNAQWVPEYMRTYLELKWKNSKKTIEKKDLLPIARGHIRDENKLAGQTDTLLLLDTNMLQIKTYCQYYYNGWCPAQIIKASQTHQYDYYFLTSVDVPWEKDNLRDRPNDRDKMFRIFEQQLIDKNTPYTILEGTKQERLINAIAIINRLLKHK